VLDSSVGYVVARGGWLMGGGGEHLAVLDSSVRYVVSRGGWLIEGGAGGHRAAAQSV
jgi:hypothetical protein